MATVNLIEGLREYGSDWTETQRGMQDMTGIKSARIEQHKDKEGNVLPWAVAFVSVATGRPKFVTIAKNQQEEAASRNGEILSAVEVAQFVDSDGETHLRAFI